MPKTSPVTLLALFSLFSAATPALAVTDSSFKMPAKLGTLTTGKPAFLSLEDTRTSAGKALIVSSFNPFGSDGLTMFESIGDHLTKFSSAQATSLGSVRWPNEAHMAPDNFISEDVLVVAGGFLVPGKATGAITLVRPSDATHFPITKDKQGYFYHRTEFVDMNGDGRLDIVTARTNKPIFGPSQGELLWLEQPATSALSSTWKEHMMAQGPDVHFRMEDLDADGAQEIVTADFFSKRLSLWWKEGDTYVTRVVDADIGSAFDVEVVDVNGDGKKDILATNHEGGSAGAVYAYEIPADMKKGAFKRHALLKDIETRQAGFRQASPGSATSFFPSKDDKGKPVILVSGDGSQRAHVLVAKSESATNWDYVEYELVNAQSTVGMSAVGDTNGDGKVEIFVPAYDKNVIHAFSFGTGSAN